LQNLARIESNLRDIDSLNLLSALAASLQASIPIKRLHDPIQVEDARAMISLQRCGITD
jgi:hypothetical protein